MPCVPLLPIIELLEGSYVMLDALLELIGSRQGMARSGSGPKDSGTRFDRSWRWWPSTNEGVVAAWV